MPLWLFPQIYRTKWLIHYTRFDIGRLTFDNWFRYMLLTHNICRDPLLLEWIVLTVTYCIVYGSNWMCRMARGAIIKNIMIMKIIVWKSIQLGNISAFVRITETLHGTLSSYWTLQVTNQKNIDIFDKTIIIKSCHKCVKAFLIIALHCYETLFQRSLTKILIY